MKKGSKKGKKTHSKRQTIPTSPVTVTLFEDRVEVTRMASVVLGDAGEHWVSLEGLSAYVDDRSVRTSVASDHAELITARVVRSVDWLSEGGDEEIDALDEAAQMADDGVAHEVMALERNRQSQKRSAKLALQWIAAVSKVPPCGAENEKNAWRAAFEELDNVLTDTTKQWAEIQERLEKAHDVQRRARARYQQARNWHPVCRAIVEAQLRCEKPKTKVELQIVYRAPWALWRPEHMARLRVSSDEAPEGTIEWTTWATVWQATGERWDDVSLKLSTARTTKAATAPILKDDVLRLRTKAAEEQRTVTVEARDEDIAVTGIAGQRSTVSEMPGVDDGGEPLVLEASQPVSIPSDGEPYRIKLDSFQLDASVKRILIGERSPLAHFKATTSLKNDTPILAGPVRLARNNAMIGRSQVDFVAPGETFEVGFGPDDGLVVKREQHESRDRTRLAGKQIITRTVEIFISNLSGTPKDVEVTERIPVSEIEAVDVSLLEAPEWELKDEHGMIRQNTSVESQGTATLSLKYEIRAKSNVALPF